MHELKEFQKGITAHVPPAQSNESRHEDLTLAVERLEQTNNDISAQLQSALNLMEEAVHEKEELEGDKIRLQRVLETDSMGVLFFNYEGVLIDANEVFLSMTNYTRDEVRSRMLDWRKLTPVDWVSLSEAQWELLWTTGRIGPYEKEYLCKDGSRSWMLFTGRDLGDGTIVEFAIDINERKRIEKRVQEAQERYWNQLEAEIANRTSELQQSRDLLQATMDSSMDMIRVFQSVRNEEGEIVDFKCILSNHASAKRHGELVGKTLLEFNPQAVEVGLFDTFKNVVETGKSDQRELHYNTNNVDEWFCQSTVKLQDGVATTVADITERKKAEQALRDSTAFIEEITASTPDLITIHNAETNAILYSNENDFWDGYSKDELISMEDSERAELMTAEEDVERAKMFVRLRRELKGSDVLEGDFRMKNGKWISIRSKVFKRDESGSATQHISFTSDITERKKSEQEILRLKEKVAQHAEDRYRILFNTMEEGFSSCEVIRNERGAIVDWRYNDVNPAVEKLTGKSAEELIGRRASEVFPGLDSSWLETIIRVFSTLQPGHFERYNNVLDRWYEVTLFPFGTEHFAALYYETTERKKAEATLLKSVQKKTFLLKLSDALRSLSCPLQVMEVAASMVGKHLNVDRVAYAEMDDEEIIVQHDFTSGVPSIVGRYPKESFGKKVIDAFFSSGTYWEENIPEAPGLSDAELEALQSISVTAYLGCTLSKEGDVSASFALHSAKPRKWTEYEISLIEDVAERVWAAVGKARVEEALSQREERYRTLFNSIDEGFCIIELIYDGGNLPVDWIYLEASPTFERQMGVNPVGKKVSELIPDIESFWFQFYGDVVKTRKPSRTENQVASIDRWYGIYASPVGNAGRQIAVIFDDITERKRSEAVLRASEERKSFLLLLNDALRPLTDSAEIKDTACALLGQHLAANRVNYFEIIGDEFVTGGGYTKDVVPIIGGTVVDFGEIWMNEFHNNELITSDNIYIDSRFSESERENVLEFDIVAFIVVMLVQDGKWVSAFSVHSKVARNWTKDETYLVREVAGRIQQAAQRGYAERSLLESQERLRVLVERYRTALQSAGMASWDWNMTSNQIILNDQHYALLNTGNDSEPKDPAYFLKFVHDDDKQPVQVAIREAADHTGVYRQEFRVARVDGTLRWVSVYGRVIEVSIDGKAERMVGVIHDITDRKRIEHLKDEFIATASHELKTPVTSIKVYADIIEERFEKSGDLDNAGLMQKMNVQIDGLTKLIKDLLDTSNIAEGKLIFRPKVFDLNQLIREQIEQFQLISRKHAIAFHSERDCVDVEADRERIGQVITNLLSNAIKYTPSEREITITVGIDENFVRVSVADEGIGIPSGDLGNVFERFFRGGNTTAQIFSGMGLGLYISAGIVKRHGGSVSVNSKEGEGSVFSFTLPLDSTNGEHS
jgi:PAS domain S-box-containing protein